MNENNNSYKDYYKVNHRKRLINWIIFYSVLAVFFIFFIVKQIDKVNTLNFANGQLGIVMTKAQYIAGDTISFKILNGFNLPITLIDKCPKPWLHTYSYSNGVWNQISANTSASYCAKQPSQLTIKPKGSISENYNQWPKLFSTPGIYRIAILATNYPSLAYADFQVVAKNIILQAPSPVVIYKPVYTPVYVQPSGSDGGGSTTTGGDN